MAREIPPEWQRLFDAAGLPSARRVAEKAGVSTDAVLRVIFNGQSGSTSIRKVATALNLDPEKVAAMRGEVIYQEFVPIEGAERLTDTQRTAVNAVIRAMLDDALPEDRRRSRLHSVPVAARKAPGPKERDRPR